MTSTYFILVKIFDMTTNPAIDEPFNEKFI